MQFGSRSVKEELIVNYARNHVLHKNTVQNKPTLSRLSDVFRGKFFVEYEEICMFRDCLHMFLRGCVFVVGGVGGFVLRRFEVFKMFACLMWDHFRNRQKCVKG